MPQLKFQKILSVSSEEKNFPADNLLKQGEFKKWKCVSGESKAIVTLQLSEASEIEKIDIGNEGSALIEVFVGKSCMKEDDYQVILVASSFMNPNESRTGINPNRVRLFSKEQLSKTVMDQKWDVVKIVCTQPFNKSVSYGLSFISLHSSQPVSTEKPEKPASVNLGAFALKRDDDKGTSSSFKAGSLFERSKHKQQQLGSPSISIAAAIRDASNSSKFQESAPSTPKSSRSNISVESEPSEHKASKSSEASSSNKHSGASSSTSFYASAEKNSNKSLISDRDAKKQSNKDPIVKQPNKDPEVKKSSEGSNSSGKKRNRESSISDEPSAKKFKHENESQEKPKPFNQLMSKVFFVLSGFQNPLRGQLRDKALSMGAKYKADWDKSCTHLICAFENTPKYNQVRGQGRIVKKDWIIESFEKKKLLPWRKYRLGRAPSPQNSQSDQEDDKIIPTAPKTDLPITRDEPKIISCEPSVEKPKITDPFEALTDSESEIDEETNRPEKPKVCTTQLGDDDDDDDAMHEFLPDLPNFLSGLKFFLYGNFTTDDRKCIRRYVTAYDGCLVDYMNDDVTAVITFEIWDEHFDKALEDNARLIFLHPDWLIECIEQQKAVPYKPFIISTP